MIELRRRRINNNSDYIHDGLILHLDGINIGNNDGYWTDQIGGRKFTIEGDVYHNIDRMIFNGGFCSKIVEDADRIDSTDVTVHVCFKCYSTSAQIWLFSFPPINPTDIPQNQVSTFFLLQNGNSVQFSRPKEVGYLIGDILTNNTCSVNSELGISNFITLDDGHKEWWGGYDECNIGRRSSVHPVTFFGEIMNIMIYNRKLSKEEMLHNQNIDNKRFNLRLEQ
jgi:hypothetical protein